MEEWLLAQNGWVLYVALFAMLLGGVIGLPIPEDIPLLMGGILIQIGKCKPLFVFLVCYVSVVLGDVFIFTIGRYFGPKVFKLRWFDKRETKTRLKRIRVGLERKSILMIFLARHLFYVRTLTFLSCGALHMRYSRFVIADMIAALISVPLMITLGYFAADSYDQMALYMHEAKVISLLVLLILVGAYMVYRQRRIPEPDDAPDVNVEALPEDDLKPID